MSVFIITVRYTAKSGMRGEFVKRVNDAGLPGIFRGEKGCLKYDYYYPADGGEDDVCLFEIWESAADQAEHMKTDAIKRLREIKEECTVGSVVTKYDAVPLA